MSDWRSYDSGAATHNSLAVPAFFAAPARDLVAALDVKAGDWVLDVGSGSGAAAMAALEATSGSARVVSLDPSPNMLCTARQNGVAIVVAGKAPGLPFADGCFDRAMASFVVSHVGPLQEALRDMLRVVRTGGRIGLTAWGTKTDPYRTLWDQMAEAASGRERLQAALQEGVPWQDWLADPANFQSALEQAGAANVEVIGRQYPVSMSIEDFLAVRNNSMYARFLRTTLNAEDWNRFQERVLAEFHSRFRDPIDHVRDAWIGVGGRA